MRNNRTNHPTLPSQAEWNGFEDIYVRHSPWLKSVLRRHGSPEGLEDIIHETFCRLNGSNSSSARTTRPLLLRIATNLLKDHWRSQTRRERPAYKATLAAHGPASTHADQFEYVLLRDIVRSLPPLQREVFVLHRFGGKTYAEIAAILGISVKAVERRMSEALASCTETLRD